MAQKKRTPHARIKQKRWVRHLIIQLAGERNVDDPCFSLRTRSHISNDQHVTQLFSRLKSWCRLAANCFMAELMFAPFDKSLHRINCFGTIYSIATQKNSNFSYDLWFRLHERERTRASCKRHLNDMTQCKWNLWMKFELRCRSSLAVAVIGNNYCLWMFFCLMSSLYCR